MIIVATRWKVRNPSLHWPVLRTAAMALGMTGKDMLLLADGLDSAGLQSLINKMLTTKNKVNYSHCLLHQAAVYSIIILYE